MVPVEMPLFAMSPIERPALEAQAFETPSVDLLSPDLLMALPVLSPATPLTAEAAEADNQIVARAAAITEKEAPLLPPSVPVEELAAPETDGNFHSDSSAARWKSKRS